MHSNKEINDVAAACSICEQKVGYEPNMYEHWRDLRWSEMGSSHAKSILENHRGSELTPSHAFYISTAQCIVSGYAFMEGWLYQFQDCRGGCTICLLKVRYEHDRV